jgi:hypothetical protein
VAPEPLAKESLLADPSQRERPITLLGRGSKLLAARSPDDAHAGRCDHVLLEGFFPVAKRDEMPARARRAGLQELGLPVRRRCGGHAPPRALPVTAGGAGGGDGADPPGPSGLACPTHVLFNGGVMKAPALRARVVDVLSDWLRGEGVRAARRASRAGGAGPRSRRRAGAAYYGLARRGRGIRIRSGASRTYYVGIESAMPAVPGLPAPLKALCVVPFGMEEGTSLEVPKRVRPGGGGAGRVPVPQFDRAQGDQPGASSRTGATTSRSWVRWR